MRLLLSDQGLIFVHLDWHVAHYAKVVLDEVFRKNFVNEIVWKRTRALHSDARRFGNVHDTIFVYSKSESHEFNPQYVPLKPEYRTRFNQTDEKGRHYRLIPAHAAGKGPPRKFGDRVLPPPPGRHWTSSQSAGDNSSHDQCIGLAQQFVLTGGLIVVTARAVEVILVETGVEEVFPPSAIIPFAILVVRLAVILIGAGIAFACGPG